MAFRCMIFCVWMGMSAWVHAENTPPTEVAPLQESSAPESGQSRLYVPTKNITVRSVEDVQKILATELKAAKQRNKQ